VQQRPGNGEDRGFCHAFGIRHRIGQPAASPAGSSAAAPVPAGYTRVGGAAQGITIAASYQVLSSSQGTIYGSQLEVLPAPDKICFVTVTVGEGESDGNVVSTAAATAQFP